MNRFLLVSWILASVILYAGGFVVGSGIEQVGILSGFQAGVLGVAILEALINVGFVWFVDDGDLGGRGPPPEPAPP